MYLNLNSKNRAANGLNSRSSGRIASLLSSVRESGLPSLFSFDGRLGRRGYWIMLLWAHLVPMIACLPFMVWATVWRGIAPGYWRFALAYLKMSAGEAFGILGIVVAGGLYYWMLSATLVKRLHDLNLSGWVALIYLPVLGLVAVLGGFDGLSGRWDTVIYLTRYFYPILLVAQGRLSVWGALWFYLTPYFSILWILQGSIKGTHGTNHYGADPVAVVQMRIS